ncbi:MAG: 4Fe-4S binding protein [Vulcanibacillus sp.]
MVPNKSNLTIKDNKVNIGILSGKGGTGKTTVSTNLAVTLNANYIDCDVEEPNGFIFLDPKDIKTEQVYVNYPLIDKNKCVGCGKCVKACEFNALAMVNKEVLLFEQLCHDCGVCQYVCDYDAITYQERVLGIIDEGTYNNLTCKRGVLNIGEPMAVPIIKELLKGLENGLNILDFAPGTSCNVVNSLLNTNFAILVTEPTEFGLHDLKMAVQLVREFNIPLGVIVNKHIEGENMVRDYCKDEGIVVLGEIPYSKVAAEAYSTGKMLIELPEYKKIFEEIAKKIKEVFPWN